MYITCSRRLRTVRLSVFWREQYREKGETER